MLEITHGSVRIMRSYDYNHFEIVLGYISADGPPTVADVDNLRKEANRLADKAVDQFKIARKAIEIEEDMKTRWRLKMAEERPEGERTPEDKAIIKYHSDAKFRARYSYDYQDDWDPQYEDDDE